VGPSLKSLETADLLTRKYAEAVRFAEQHELAFADLDESINQTLRAEWRSMSTEPHFENHRWVSVFSMTESPGKLQGIAIGPLFSLNS
jgi:hypothetical protein